MQSGERFSFEEGVCLGTTRTTRNDIWARPMKIPMDMKSRV